jgi:cytoskeletal protein CcmA (bactofilin family)
VGAGTTVEGEVQGPGDLVVRGSLRGRVSMGGTVRLEPESDVRADIRAPRVVIVDGAVFQGEVDTSGTAPVEAVADPAANPSLDPVATGEGPVPADAGLEPLRRRIRLRGT